MLLFGAVLAKGQAPDARHFSFGYLLGVETQMLNVGMLRGSVNGLHATAGSASVGGSGGIWGQWQVMPVLHVRSGLNFSWSANRIRYFSDDGMQKEQRYPFFEIGAPLHFILSNPLHRLPLQGVILFGGQVSWNLASNPSSAPVALLPERLGIDLGFGAGFKWGKWNLQPELLISFGINNIHDFTNNPYDWVVGRVNRDRLCLRVAFGRANVD